MVVVSEALVVVVIEIPREATLRYDYDIGRLWAPLLNQALPFLGLSLARRCVQYAPRQTIGDVV